jgi:GTP:adenosylcobinamide-phosphate guanylyltransferase
MNYHLMYTKKYAIDEANAAIDDIFLNYKKQYLKKKEYDKKYFVINNKKIKEYIIDLQTELQKYKKENEALKAKYGKK